jgi:hypothetical protein
VRQFDFAFIWLFPFVVVLWGYFDLMRGYVSSGREKLGWGVAIATFGCVLLAIIGGGLTYPVRSELMRAVPTHVLLPLAMYWLTRSSVGGTGGGEAKVSMSTLGRYALNVVLSAGVMAIGIWLTVLLIRSEVFSNSVIVIGFIPIPGMVMVATPIIPAILGVLYIWEHNR